MKKNERNTKSPAKATTRKRPYAKTMKALFAAKLKLKMT